MPPYALAIFDFDGTLADSWRLMGQAIIEAADRFGYRRPSPEEAQALRGLDNRAVMQALGVRMWQLPRIGLLMRQVAAAQCDQIALFPGVEALLPALVEAGVGIAVVSSNAESTIRQVLGPDLAALVSEYDCGAALFGKAARFTRVVNRATLAPARAIAIGDEARDVEAARAARVASGAVTWGYATRDLLVSCSPTHVFDTIDEMTAALTER